MNGEKTSRKRASRYKHSKKPRRMRMTPRDREVIKAVNDFRVMRQDQIQRLMFPSKNTAQVRLRVLWEHRYLRRHFLPVIGGIQTSPILYTIDKRGAELLRSEYGYIAKSLRLPRRKLSPRFLEHTLGLSEIRLSAERACRENGFKLKNWLDEKALKADYDRVQVGTRLVSVLPDAYFVISIPRGETHFFLEYDRGDESLKVFKKKLIAYWAYFQSGKCRARYGTNRIRVLTVTEGGQTQAGQRRTVNLKRLAIELRGRRWFRFGTLEQVRAGDFFLDTFWLQVDGEAAAALLSM